MGEEYEKGLGFINWAAMKATHFPELEKSDNIISKYSSKAARNVFGRYFAGNMTSREQGLYGEAYGINPRNLTIHNTIGNAVFMYATTVLSDSAGIEGSKDDLSLWMFWGFCNLPKTIFAIKNNKGYQPWTPGAFIQNSTTYLNIMKKGLEKAVDRGRDTAKGLGQVEDDVGLEQYVEYEKIPEKKSRKDN